MTEGDARSGSIGCDLGPEDAQALLRAWLDAVDLRMSERDLLALLQSDGFSHAGLERRARRCHERRLEARGGARDRRPVADRGRRRRTCSRPASRRSRTRRPPPSSAARRASSPRATTSRVRVALVADGIGGMHGVTHTIDEIRERGVPGFEVEVIGTDAHVDRRLSAVAEVEIPFYAGLRGRRAEPAGGGRRARRGPLRRAARVLARAGRRRRRADRPRDGAAAGRLLPHRARRLHGAALRRRGPRGRRRHRARRLLRRLRRGAVAVGGVRRAARRARHRARARRPLGPRRRHRPLLARAAHARAGRRACGSSTPAG